MERESKKEMKKNVPLGVKIISIFLILIGLILVFILPIFNMGVGMTSKSDALLRYLIIYLLPSALLLIFAIFLWKGKNWARILVALFFLILILAYLATLIVSRNNLNLKIFPYVSWPFSCIGLVIFAYLIFSKKVKGAFV